LVALFDLRFEGELLLLAIDVELDLSGPDINMAFAVLKNGLPKMSGVLASTSMSSMTKSTGIKKFWIFTGIFSAIPAG